MLLTARQTRLAETIDTHVRQVLAQGGDDDALLLSLADSKYLDINFGIFQAV